jgi:NADP-dependent 3-hydroxy acid dehydrogenase YdfG
MKDTLEGKTAVITGASQGIGRAISLALSNNAVNVVIASRNQGKLLTLRDEITKGGGNALVVKTDVGSISDCKHLAEQALSVYGQIDILVNNAALRVVGPIDTSDPDAITEMVQVNLLGAYYCAHAVLPSMKARSSGHIINISSGVGRKYFPRGPMYSATKFGVRAFSESLRSQVQKWRIRVTTVYPGLADTQMVTDYTPAEREKFLRPEGVAHAIIHALEYPEDVSMTEIAIRSTWQEQ